MSSPPPMSRPSKKATVTASLEATARMKMSAPASASGSCTRAANVETDTTAAVWLVASAFQSDPASRRA